MNTAELKKFVNQKNDIFAESVCNEMDGDFFVYTEEFERQPSFGWIFNTEKERMEPNRPYESWIFDEEMFFWKSPVDYPKDGKNYRWNESIINWVQDTLDTAV